MPITPQMIRDKPQTYQAVTRLMALPIPDDQLAQVLNALADEAERVVQGQQAGAQPAPAPTRGSIPAESAQVVPHGVAPTPY
jgi:hypothetical protein